MTTFAPSRQVLDEDLQIVRGTLAAITDDVRHLSPRAADAIRDALQRLDVAQQEISKLQWMDHLRGEASG